MSKRPVPLSRPSSPRPAPEQGDLSDLSLLQPFDSSPETTGLVTGPCPEPPRHLEVTWSTDAQGRLDAAIVGYVTADNAWQLRRQLLRLLLLQPPVLTLRLDAAQFVGPEGLQALVTAVRRARDVGVDLRLAVSDRRALRVTDSPEPPADPPKTCTQTTCRPGGDPSGKDASQTQPAPWAADPDPVSCPTIPIGVPEETL